MRFDLQRHMAVAQMIASARQQQGIRAIDAGHGFSGGAHLHHNAGFIGQQITLAQL